ncbi:TetR/AcrR family transcriptional regulator [Planococcus sp. SE5232]|uniref:TetR/AcrR family transcriptional regulator n=1 Tax=unclassified Planococcus (in: firmicutes) TaxID=2662419 RepID=UPI001CC1128D|nr:TetR/AcrR family transcriptional regulator [Planococcus sp. 4-30]
MKKDRRIDKSKMALKEALIRLMEEKEFKSITITEIVHSANLNRGTFYKHYQTQEELLNELIDDVLIDLIHSYREPYVKIKDFDVGKLSAASVKIFDHVERYSRFYTIIVNSNVLPGFQNRICQVLKELVQKELISPMPTPGIDPSLLSSYNAYALFGLIIEWVSGDFKFTSQQMADQLINILSYQTPRAEAITVFKEKNLR